MSSLWLGVSQLWKKSNCCRSNCSSHSSSSTPRYFNDSSIGNYLPDSWFSATICAHLSLCSMPSHLHAMNYHQPAVRAAQLFSSWNGQDSDLPDLIHTARWGGSNPEQKDGETQMFPIMIDISEFHMASFIFLSRIEKKAVDNLMLFWVMIGCRTEVPYEITLPLFVPTSIWRKGTSA